jgi:hypothetical protein
MLCASGSMVFILYRHKQKMQHVHRASISPDPPLSPELPKLSFCWWVSLFLHAFLHLQVALIYHPSFFLVNANTINVNDCFSTLSPFLLLRCGSSAFSLCYPWIRSRKTTKCYDNHVNGKFCTILSCLFSHTNRTVSAAINGDITWEGWLIQINCV